MDIHYELSKIINIWKNLNDVCTFALTVTHSVFTASSNPCTFFNKKKINQIFNWQLKKQAAENQIFFYTGTLTLSVTAGEQGGQEPEGHGEKRHPSPHLLPGTETHKHIYLDIPPKQQANNSTTGQRNCTTGQREQKLFDTHRKASAHQGGAKTGCSRHGKHQGYLHFHLSFSQLNICKHIHMHAITQLQLDNM